MAYWVVTREGLASKSVLVEADSWGEAFGQVPEAERVRNATQADIETLSTKSVKKVTVRK